MGGLLAAVAAPHQAAGDVGVRPSSSLAVALALVVEACRHHLALVVVHQTHQGPKPRARGGGKRAYTKEREARLVLRDPDTCTEQQASASVAKRHYAEL